MDPLHHNKLPAELRKNVYELVIVFDKPSGPVKPEEACPPSKTILFTWKQTCAEARAIYRVANRAYWAETCFKVTPSEHTRTYDRYIDCITQDLHEETLCLSCPLSLDLGAMTWAFEDEVWRQDGWMNDFVVDPPEKIHEVKSAGFPLERVSIEPWTVVLGVSCASHSTRDNDLARVAMIVGKPKLTPRT